MGAAPAASSDLMLGALTSAHSGLERSRVLGI